MTQQASIIRLGKDGLRSAVVGHSILDQQVNGKPLFILIRQHLPEAGGSGYHVFCLQPDLYQCSSRPALLSEASTDAYEAVRGKVAQLIGARSEKEIVFTSGATTKHANPIAHCYGNTNLGEDDEV